MPEVTIVYWRDIPAQVIVGKGRRGVKRQLTERFEKAIDMAAMRAGMAGTDDYLTAWRKAAPYTVEGDAVSIAEQEATRLETEYDIARILRLIGNHGHGQS